MLVNVRQYREDDAKATLRSNGAVSPDRDGADYFAVEDLDADEGWERIERDDGAVLVRPVSYQDVTAVSVPRDEAPSTPDASGSDEADDDLPGRTLMLRRGGGEQFVENAELVEVQDPDP